jgi:hypothetical protein
VLATREGILAENFSGSLLSSCYQRLTGSHKGSRLKSAIINNISGIFLLYKLSMKDKETQYER